MAEGWRLTQGGVGHITGNDTRSSGQQVKAVHCLRHAVGQLRVPTAKVSHHPGRALLLEPGCGQGYGLHWPVLSLLPKALQASGISHADNSSTSIGLSHAKGHLLNTVAFVETLAQSA